MPTKPSAIQILKLVHRSIGSSPSGYAGARAQPNRPDGGAIAKLCTFRAGDSVPNVIETKFLLLLIIKLMAHKTAILPIVKISLDFKVIYILYKFAQIFESELVPEFSHNLHKSVIIRSLRS